MVTSVRRVADIMAEITAASTEQSQGIEQICIAVSQMDEVTQQNAALVEQAAAAAESLKDQGELIMGAVSVFNFSGANSHPVSASGTRPTLSKAHKRHTAPARLSVTKPQLEVTIKKRAAQPMPNTASADGGNWEEF